MDRATGIEAPIGVVTPLNAQWQWSTVASGFDLATADRRAGVVHEATGTGQYEVRLPGVASARGRDRARDRDW